MANKTNPFDIKFDFTDYLLADYSGLPVTMVSYELRGKQYVFKLDEYVKSHTKDGAYYRFDKSGKCQSFNDEPAAIEGLGGHNTTLSWMRNSQLHRELPKPAVERQHSNFGAVPSKEYYLYGYHLEWIVDSDEKENILFVDTLMGDHVKAKLHSKEYYDALFRFYKYKSSLWGKAWVKDFIRKLYRVEHRELANFLRDNRDV